MSGSIPMAQPTSPAPHGPVPSPSHDSEISPGMYGQRESGQPSAPARRHAAAPPAETSSVLAAAAGDTGRYGTSAAGPPPAGRPARSRFRTRRAWLGFRPAPGLDAAGGLRPA